MHPQHEEYWGNVNPIGPRACYDEGKRVAETMTYAYANQVSMVEEKVFFREFLSSILCGDRDDSEGIACECVVFVC